MKKILIILISFWGLVSCEENKFEDFNYSAVYFPNQFPIRTFDVSEDASGTAYKFQIPAVIGGVYKNTKDRVLDIEIASELCSGALFQSTKDPICLMPSAYYSLSTPNTLKIPAGELYGHVEVQLKDAFFNDPLASKLYYVIPVRIKGSMDVDSVLSGKSTSANPDPRITSQWTMAPRNFTMFAVKYMNKYQGNYYHKGQSVVKDAAGKVVENNVYRTPNIVNSEVWNLVTTGKSQAFVSGNINSKIFSGNLLMNLTFDNGNSGSVIQTKDASIPVTGTCTFIKDGEVVDGGKRNSVVLSYKYSVPYTAPVLEGPIQKRNDVDPSIIYTGTWQKLVQDGNFNSDISYSSTVGNNFTFKFTGDGIALYFKTGPSYGSFDVYLDDMNNPVATNVSTKTPATQFQQKLFEKKGLSFIQHTLKVVIKEASNTIFDYLIYTVPQDVLPSGIYTFEAKDTLVVKNRVVSIESYTPVVQ